MRTVTVGRRHDGLPQITRDEGHMPAEERHLVMATLFFVVAGFFLSGYAPFLLIAGLSSAFALGEAIMVVDALAKRRGAPAEVRELALARWRRR
jgi:hypothetical protein